VTDRTERTCSGKTSPNPQQQTSDVTPAHSSTLVARIFPAVTLSHCLCVSLSMCGYQCVFVSLSMCVFLSHCMTASV